MTQAQLIASIMQAIMEDYHCVHLIRKFAETDEDAARYGALTPRVAYILREPLPLVRRKLQDLANRGILLRNMPYQSTIRWWPVGYLPIIKPKDQS